MRKVLIIEDEWVSARRLEKLLADIDDTMQVEGPLKSVEEVRSMLMNHNDFDVIFADIRLTDGDVFEAFRDVMPTGMVVFTTAYDEYAMQAIKCNGLDYLLKPIDEEELLQTLHRLDGLTSHLAEHHGRLQAVSDCVDRYRERFLAYRQDELIPVSTHDILFFHKEERKVSLTTAEGQVYTLPLTMQELEEQLSPKEFFRINRQYMVNLRGIRKISQFFHSKLLVRLHGCADNRIVVSKERAALFKEWLDR